MKSGAASRLPSALVVLLPPRAGARLVVAETAEPAVETPEPDGNRHLQSTDMVRLVTNWQTFPPATAPVALYRFSRRESIESPADEGF